MNRALLGRSKGVLGLAAGLLLIAVAGVGGLGSDNSPEVWFVRGSDAVVRDARMQESFPRHEFLRIAVWGVDLDRPETWSFLESLESGAAKVPGVLRSVGLRAWADGLGLSGGVPVFPRVEDAALPRAMGWISGDGSVATVTIELEASAERDEVVRALEGLERRVGSLRAEAPDDLRVEIVGLPVLNRALDASTEEVGRRFVPALVVVTVVLILAVLRDFRALLVALGLVALAEGAAIGSMGWLGVQWNLVLATLPPLLYAITLATTLHLLLRYRSDRRTRPPQEAALATWKAKGWSVVATGGTTIVGFLALSASPVGPVRDLGLWIAVAVGLATLSAAFVGPVLLALADPGRGGASTYERVAERLGAACGGFAARRRGVVQMFAALVAAGALIGLSGLGVESNALRYLSPDHPVRAGFEALEEAGIGLATVEIIATRERPFVAEELAALADLRLESPALHRVDPSTFLAEAHSRASFGLDGQLSDAMLWAVLRSSSQVEADLRSVVTSDTRGLRIVVFVETAGAEVLGPAMQRWRRKVEDELPGATVEVGGRFPLLLETQGTLLRTLSVSLAITAGLVGVVLWLLLGSLRMAFLAFLPNLWPVVGILGVMGWARIPVDVATVMVASVVLGLAVDDTIHTLGPFRRLAPRIGPEKAVVEVLRRTAGAYVLTAVVLAAGFAVCGLSDFAPTRRFGLLSALAVGLALIGDLLLLPALLSAAPRSGKSQDSSGSA